MHIFEIPLKVVIKKSKRPVSNTSNALSKNSKILLSKTFVVWSKFAETRSIQNQLFGMFHIKIVSKSY